MKTLDRNRFRISEEAAQWLMRLEQDDSERCQAEFAAWSRRSPQHVEEFLFAKATWQHLGSVDPEHRIDLAQLGSPDVIVPMQHHALKEAAGWNRNRRIRSFAVVACIAAIIFMCGYWLVDSERTRDYATATGNQMTVKLPDGSVLYLNTHSRVAVRFGKQARDIQLLEGEALFVVEREAARPFRVLTDGVMIQALGTQFNVYRKTEGPRVSVVDGAVQVIPKGDAPLKLAAGEEANVAHDKIVKTAKPNVQRATAWRMRRLMFQADPLEEVAAEFNRYDGRRSIRLEGADVRRRLVSGVFDADDSRPLIEFLEEDPQLSVIQGEREIVIRQR